MISDTTIDTIENRVLTNRPMTVRVPAQLHDELRRRARDEGEFESSIIRRALRRELLIETR